MVWRRQHPAPGRPWIVRTAVTQRRRIPSWPALSVLALAATLGGTARAQDSDDGGIRIGGITLRPYVYGQFDLGDTWGGKPDAPDGGVQTRRFRLGARAELPRDVTLGFIWDFGDEGFDGPRWGHSRLYEAKVEYSGLKPFTIRAGAFEPTLTMEDSQSSAETLFLEHAAIVDLAGAIVEGGRTGVEIGAQGDRWLTSLGLIGPRVGYGDDARERAVMGRVAGLVVQRENFAVHLGLDGLWRFRTPQENGQRPGVELSNAPEYTISPESYLSTGFIEAKSMASGGVEAGVAAGPFWASGEWYRIAVDRTDGKNPWFGGWYAQAAWMLTGARRQWSSEDGAWAAPKPEAFDPSRGQWGSVELGGRFSHANLRSADIDGGEQDVWSASLGWWPHETVRVLLQYQHARIKGGEDPHRFQAVTLRLQFRLD
jgi:phosphate-selective porin OprO/OprP